MFDLASKVTGVCLWDIKNKKPVTTFVIQVKNNEELGIASLHKQIDILFKNLENNFQITKDQILVSKEQAPIQVHNKFTTAQTLISLGKSHAVLDLYCYNNNIDVYDYVGVAPITTHCYFKKVTDWPKERPVAKDDIRDYLYSIKEYNLQDISLDESDAVFLAKTLVELH